MTVRRPRPDVILTGRQGLWTTEDGFIVERDEAVPYLSVWLVSLPKNVKGYEGLVVQCLGFKDTAETIAAARVALDNPLALANLGFGHPECLAMGHLTVAGDPSGKCSLCGVTVS